MLTARSSKPGLNRRELVALGGGAILSAGVAGVASAAETSLHALAQQKGLRFGSVPHRVTPAVAGGPIYDATTMGIIKSQCGLVVPEGELKPRSTWSGPTSYNWKLSDQFMDEAAKNHLQARGHNLFWVKENHYPDWLKTYDFGANEKVAAEDIFRKYIAAVTQRYSGKILNNDNVYVPKIVSWDVINEAVNPDTGELISHRMGNILGLREFQAIAFRAARENLPNTELVYNDYCLSWGKLAQYNIFTNGVLDLLRWFRDNNVPVDTLGLQSHLRAEYNVENMRPFLDEVVNTLGYRLAVTELDVRDSYIASDDIGVRDAAVAKTTKEWLDLILSYKSTRDVLTWGMVDKDSWWQAGATREVRCLPYDSNYQKKPMYDAIAAAFTATAPRAG